MPSRARRCDGAAVMSAPSKVTRPAEARMMPISVFKSVVLPMPLWPSTPTNSPAATANDTPFSTWIRPYPADSSPTVSMAGPSPAPRERKGPNPQGWEGEGRADARSRSPATPSPGSLSLATLSRGAGDGPNGNADSRLPSRSRRFVPAEIDVAHRGVGHDPVEGFLDQNPALVEDGDAGRDLADELHVVLDHHQGDGAVDLADQRGGAVGLLGAHPGRGLVQQHDPGLAHHHQAHLDPFPLAMRQLPHQPVGEPAHRHAPDHRPDARRRRRG